MTIQPAGSARTEPSLERHRSPRPTVSVLLPVLNERRYVWDCMAALLAQDGADVLEILVADGGSDDGTQELAKAAGPPVRVVENLGVTAAAGLNRALAEATGDIVVRADAHTVYGRDYVRSCVDVLLETGADNVGGPMRPAGTTSFGRAVAAATTSPFGVGPGKFHYSERREEADTVYLGCWWRDTLSSLGGFDEDRLQWGAEDHELNFRLTRRGGRIVLDPSIRSWYFPRDTPRRLASQYFNYGLGKASTLSKHRSLPSWRPLAPAALVVTSLALAATGRGRSRVAIPAVHAVFCSVAAWQAGKDPGVAPHRVFAAFEICHWSYGAGFLVGCARALSGRAFTSRPKRRA